MAIVPGSGVNFFLRLFREDLRLMTYFVLVGPLLSFVLCIAAQVDYFLLVSYAELGLLAGPLWILACIRNFNTK